MSGHQPEVTEPDWEEEGAIHSRARGHRPLASPGTIFSPGIQVKSLGVTVISLISSLTSFPWQIQAT